MKIKNQFYALLLLALASGSTTFGVFEFRTPITLNRPYWHWPKYPVQDAWWFDTMPDGRDDDRWTIQSWASVYARSAGKAFFNVEKNKNTRKTTSLSTLFFGKESFRGEEAFPGGTIQSPTNPDLVESINQNLGFAFITPVFDFNETGAFLGVTFDRMFGKDDMWHFGGRFSLPFVVVEISPDNGRQLEETLNDVIEFRLTQLDIKSDPDITTPDSYEFAYRMDFLSTLAYRNNAAIISILRQENTTKNVFVAAQQVSGNTASNFGVDNSIPPAYVIKESNREIPNVPFLRTPAQVSGELAVDGSGVDNTTYFFKAGTDYSSLLKDRSTLGTLFLVPRAQTNDAGQITDITENAKNLSIGQNGIIEQVLNQITFALGNETAVDFFEDQGIDLGKFERVVGIGDLEFQMYVGYGDRWDEWFADFMLGIRLPTGRKDKDPGRVYFLSTGHNRHFELNAGLEGGWMCCDWFALKMDGTVSHAFKKDEKRAAQFEGATIRNIGPTVEADVSWTYFVGHFDLNFFHPANNEIGAMLGYELFLRSKDRIKFEQETATFAGITGNLDAEALEVRTNSMAHKMRLEVWNRWNLFEIIAGASTVFAGRSVMKETEAHITFNVYF